MKRRPRQVHRVVGHEALVIGNDEGVGQLDPETATLVGGEILEADNQIQGLVELEVGGKCLLPQFHLVVTEITVEDLINTVEPEEGRVELDDHVDFVPRHQMPGDLVDLLGRASMES